MIALLLILLGHGVANWPEPAQTTAIETARFEAQHLRSARFARRQVVAPAATTVSPANAPPVPAVEAAKAAPKSNVAPPVPTPVAFHPAPSEPLELHLTQDEVRELWAGAADEGDLDEVVEILETFLDHASRDTSAARLARRGVEDLLALRDRRADPDGFVEEDDPIQAARRLEELSAELRYGDRSSAIHSALSELGGSRDLAAVEAILDAGSLPELTQRRHSLHLLWRIAADTGDPDGSIRDQLERARYAADASEARLAERALADLDQLAAVEHEASLESDGIGEVFQEASIFSFEEVPLSEAL